MASQEVVIALEYLYSTLSADATLQGYAPGGVHRGLAPPETTTPYVIFAYQSGTDVNTMNAYRIMTDPLFQAKAVGPASITAQIASAAERIDELLKPNQGGVTATLADGLVLSCFRESPLQTDEIVSGQQWSNIGGLYRLLVQKTS
jgi:hypothetical protein